MTRVLLIAGGTSDERDVSIRSGEATQTALEVSGYEVTLVDASLGSDAILEAAQRHDVVFLALHGKGGEDGTLQHLFETRTIAFVGSGSKASELCFDKWEYAQRIIQNNLPTPQTELVSYVQFRQSKLSTAPYVLKPNDGGSSIDTLIARDPTSVDTATIGELFSRHGTMILQQLIVGQELTVAILGDDVLPVIEIIPPMSGEFDYENKYNGESQELCPPKHIDITVQQKAQELALKAHQLTGCQDLSRTDFMLDAAHNLYILETNTIPGLTNQSLLPKAAATAGISMPQMMDLLVQRALTRT